MLSVDQYMRPASTLPLLMVLAILSSASVADACACCDGYSKRKALRWSKDGKRLLVRADIVRGCQPTKALEVWSVGAAKPDHCFDLLGDPNKKVACNKLTSSWHKKAKASKVPAAFGRAATSIRKRLVRAVYRHSGKGEARPVLLTVRVRVKRRWRTLHRLKLYEYLYTPPSDKPSKLFPLEVALLPAPAVKTKPKAKAKGRASSTSRSRRAALIVSGDNTEPSIGHRGARIVWVTLPKGLGRSASGKGVQVVTAKALTQWPGS